VYPTLSSYDHRLDLQAEKEQFVIVNWVDLTGRIVMRENLSLEKGANSFSIRNNAKLSKGNYFVTTIIDGKRFTGRIVIV
jgi:hypothetical protein